MGGVDLVAKGLDLCGLALLLLLKGLDLSGVARLLLLEAAEDVLYSERRR